MDTITKPGFSADLAHGGGTLLDVMSYLRDPTSSAYKAAGKNVKAATKFENAQLAAKGKEAFASAQRGALDEQKQADLAISRATAVAAASGGGASDPTVMKIIGNLASEGKTNALSALYQGESSQVDYTNQISANNYNAANTAAGYNLRAKALKGANYDAAYGSLLSGITPFLEKYG